MKWTQEEQDLYDGWDKLDIYKAYVEQYKIAVALREEIKELNIKLAGYRLDEARRVKSLNAGVMVKGGYE